jgi:hypothetical protein
MTKYPKLSKEEQTLRQLLWLHHGCPHSALYGDDGEMQCSHCMIDFLRLDPKEIEYKIYNINMKKYIEYLQKVPGESLLAISFNKTDKEVLESTTSTDILADKFKNLPVKEKGKYILEYLKHIPEIDKFALKELSEIL